MAIRFPGIQKLLAAMIPNHPMLRMISKKLHENKRVTRQIRQATFWNGSHIPCAKGPTEFLERSLQLADPCSLGRIKFLIRETVSVLS